METFGSLSTNQNKTQDLTMGLTNGTASASAFVTGHNPNKGTYSAGGANLGVQTPAGGASIQGTHIPKYGNQVTASANANLVNHEDHKINVHAFHTTNIPNVGPNITTHGGEVNYTYKETVGLGAATSHTHLTQTRQHSLNSSLNIHKTPTSSLDFNLGANQTTSPFGRGKWQPGGGITFVKRF